MNVDVIAHPNAKRPRIEKDLLGVLHVYVSEPPLEGRANRAIIEALSEYFEVKKSQIEFVSGIKGKNKVFTIYKEL